MLLIVAGALRANLRFAKTHARSLFTTTLACAAVLGSVSALAQVSLNTLDIPSTQNFDTLPSSGSATWVNNTTIPGWYHARTGTGATIVADTGSTNG